MRKNRREIIIVLILFALLTCYMSAYTQSIEQQLIAYDQQVMSTFYYNYPPDVRYNEILLEIGNNLNGTIVSVFGEDRDITYYVCPSPIGFNALSFYRFIVFDSLLLDSLRYLAMGQVYYGGLDNDYIDELAYTVAQLSQAHRNGNFQINWNDHVNPFGLPTPGDLNASQQKQALELFKQIVVSWMAHEGSHCMLDHLKQRMEIIQRQNNQNPYASQFNANMMNTYAMAELSQQMEKEADVHAVMWMKKSGYGVNGFVTWLKFGQKLEKAMGVAHTPDYLKTHPGCADRIKYVQEANRIYSNN